MNRNNTLLLLLGILSVSPWLQLWSLPRDGRRVSSRSFRDNSDNSTLQRFVSHLQSIEDELNRIRSHELKDWKRNENVSVGVEETADSHLVRVISLQLGGNPGIMQVSLPLLSNSTYHLELQGCALPSGQDFKVCPFVDAVHEKRRASMVLWRCRKGLVTDDEWERNGVPCSEASTHSSSDRKSRFTMRLKFRTFSNSAEYRAGLLFVNASAGNTFYVSRFCLAPSSPLSQYHGYRC
mmetsp:Transcript_23219/g.75523  ORF Transcript_23219/g.75523 Transcript_23219/m.75523 type:complete len:237 (-) Transcript_23219:47-757(-)